MEISINYTPFQRQLDAHALTEPIVGYFGGWGSGKTTWAIAEAFRNSCCLPVLSHLPSAAKDPVSDHRVRVPGSFSLASRT